MVHDELRRASAMSQAAIVVDEKDNVATALRALEAGESLPVHVSGKAVEVAVLGSIPFGHKVALAGMNKGEAVVKYGEVIGHTTGEILAGEHVHVHNVEGLKGRGRGA
jgi:altronate dehydratase small subunit